MTRIAQFSLAFLMIFLHGCAKPFQPPPPTFKLWEKPEASDDEVKRAMLECGYPSPFGGGGKTNNEIALMQLCMGKNGFFYHPQLRLFCVTYPMLDACQVANEGKIPNRDRRLRLKGPYCTEPNNRKFPACR